jgi:hypothetical protein
MVESKSYLKSKVKNKVEADDVACETVDNRYHYLLYFGKSIGFEWARSQVYNLNGTLDVEIEPYKMEPVGSTFRQSAGFVLRVREVDQRNGIDEDQRFLREYER